MTCSKDFLPGKNFYPRSPCGERPAGVISCNTRPCISIHALLAESDGASHAGSQSKPHFYPRSPCGERPAIGRRGRDARDISIHALLAESDRHWQTGLKRTRQVLSSLSLRRATPAGLTVAAPWKFLSTLSLRRATLVAHGNSAADDISIHALLAESDTAVRKETPSSGNFYPRSPCGERHLSNNSRQYLRPHFYPRSPCGERHAHLCKNP